LHVKPRICLLESLRQAKGSRKYVPFKLGKLRLKFHKIVPPAGDGTRLSTISDRKRGRDSLCLFGKRGGIEEEVVASLTGSWQIRHLVHGAMMPRPTDMPL
jgi:hypothetical protein